MPLIILYHFSSAMLHPPNSFPSFALSSASFLRRVAAGPCINFLEEMAFRIAYISLTVAAFGVLAFIFGVIAENKKPASGTPITGKGVIICKYPSDPTVALGSLSVVAVFLSTCFGFLSVFYPYKGISVPNDALFRSTTLIVFFTVAVCVTVLAEVLMVWVTVTEALHITRNVHYDLDYQCPTAKTGLFGGAAFLSLDASLFWLICQMLVLNARTDYLDEDDPKGEYGQVLVNDYNANATAKP